MSEMKTQPTEVDAESYLAAVEPARRREDGLALLALMRRVTGEAPVMWGPSIVGFGRYEYRYESGREGAFFLTGFAPRKSAMTIYVMPGFDRYAALTARLGKHKTGRSCLYVNKLQDIDIEVLEELIEKSVAWMRERYGA